MLFLWKIVRKCSCSWYAWPKIIEGIKPCSLGSRIQDVEAFWYKTEIKIIYFVPLCLNVLIVSDCMVYPDPKFLIFKKISKIEYQKFRVRVNHTIGHNENSKKTTSFIFWGCRLIFFGFETFPEMSLTFVK